MLIFNIGISSDILKANTLGSTLAPLNIGQSSPDISVSISSFTFCLANSTSIFSSNSITIEETSSCDVELILTTLLNVFNLSSKGVVINFSISSAVLPGKTELT